MASKNWGPRNRARIYMWDRKTDPSPHSYILSHSNTGPGNLNYGDWNPRSSGDTHRRQETKSNSKMATSNKPARVISGSSRY